MNYESPPSSHFQLLKSQVCHAGCAQFERQWPPENQPPFSHPISKAFQFLSLWHSPSSHEVWIEQEAAEQNQAWFEQIRQQRLHLPTICHEKNLPKHPLLFWGSSPMAQTWAKEKNLSLAASPPLDLLQEIHDKRWLEAHRLKPLLNQVESTIIDSLEALEILLKKHPSQNWMFKRTWSAAGTGNFLYHPGASLSVAQKWIEKDGHLLIQPLLSKEIDFSSLWYLTACADIKFLGCTQMLIEKGSRYAGCWIKSPQDLFSPYPDLWQDHLNEAEALLRLISKRGYFGYLGFDGLIYHKDSPMERAQAIIEVNARQTLAMHLSSCVNTLELRAPTLAKLILPSKQKEKGIISLLPPASPLAIELYTPN